MGNSSSKSKKHSNNTSSSSSTNNGSSRPAFSRSDTQNSVGGRSLRSIRSRKSVDSFKSAISSMSVGGESPGPSILTDPSSFNRNGTVAGSISEPQTPGSSNMASLTSGIAGVSISPNAASGDGQNTNDFPSDPAVHNSPHLQHKRTLSNSSIISNGSARSGNIIETQVLLTPSGTNSMPLASPFPRDIGSSSGKKIKGGNSAGSFTGSGSTGGGITIDIDEVISRLLESGFKGRTSKHICLKNNEIALICQTSREIFLSQPILLDLSAPVKIVGDVHGQFNDLLRLFDMCGYPPNANYLFLGDYVDRGKQSLETILLLLCYKIKYPENFFLLRGNHECANVTRVYGFYDECKRRCNIKTWKIFIDTFNTLPIAAIIAQKIFCVHGGLSPSLTNMNELRNIQRPTDVPDYGLLNDILWSDPADTENEWEDNERGVSYCFNKVAINKFLTKFNFDLVCRAHIVVEDGYEFFNDRTLVTVFSAPNYCGEFDNWGAVMSVSEDLLCSFELLKPMDSMALRTEMQNQRNNRRANSMAGSGPSGSMQSALGGAASQPSSLNTPGLATSV